MSDHELVRKGGRLPYLGDSPLAIVFTSTPSRPSELLKQRRQGCRSLLNVSLKTVSILTLLTICGKFVDRATKSETRFEIKDEPQMISSRSRQASSETEGLVPVSHAP